MTTSEVTMFAHASATVLPDPRHPLAGTKRRQSLRNSDDTSDRRLQHDPERVLPREAPANYPAR